MNIIDFLRRRVRRLGVRAAWYAALSATGLSVMYWSGYRGNLQSWGDIQPLARVLRFFALAYPILFVMIFFFAWPFDNDHQSLEGD